MGQPGSGKLSALVWLSISVGMAGAWVGHGLWHMEHGDGAFLMISGIIILLLVAPFHVSLHAEIRRILESGRTPGNEIPVREWRRT